MTKPKWSRGEVAASGERPHILTVGDRTMARVIFSKGKGWFWLALSQSSVNRPDHDVDVVKKEVQAMVTKAMAVADRAERKGP